jgi:hypothetical protein
MRSLVKFALSGIALAVSVAATAATEQETNPYSQPNRITEQEVLGFLGNLELGDLAIPTSITSPFMPKKGPRSRSTSTMAKVMPLP